jgi:hypothetical protein
LQDATIVLAMVAKHFAVELEPSQVVWPLLWVTLRPANGLPMIVRRRTAGSRGN